MPDRLPGRERLSASGRRAHAVATLYPWIERARTFSGWNFDDLDITDVEPPPPWDYVGLARELVLRASRVIDLGTGGGEIYSRIVAGISGVEFLASEEWLVNAPVARDRLDPIGIAVVNASSECTPWRDASFDLVLSRHEAIVPGEIARVLEPGGVFFSQQVARGEWRELGAFFPDRVTYPDHLATYRRDFESSGFHVTTEEHSWKAAYPSIGEVAFLLLLSPWEIPGFDPIRDVDNLLALEDEHGSDRGIVLTHARYLMTVTKP